MKPRAQFILAGAMLIALVAWSSAWRESPPDCGSQSCGTCCPFLPTLGGTRLTSVTNRTTTDGTPSLATTTNTTPTLKDN